MKHTIISWDCTYRNFFHIIDALLDQDYNKVEYELIYVEQRSRKFADQYNHDIGLKSLYDRYREVKGKLQIKVDYLNHDSDTPYHLGLCVNRGLELAKGDIVSVMDGDMLLPVDFLKQLDGFHENNKAVANIERRMVPEPVGVSLENWTKGIIDYKKCLEQCPDANEPIPAKVSNKGPMISAPYNAWDSVNGYDTHKIWSTGLSRLGQDVTVRLEEYLECESYSLTESVAVHPYHPTGFSRKSLNSVRLLSLQENIIQWTQKNGIFDWNKRKQLTQKVYNDHEELIEAMVNSKLSRPDEGSWSAVSKLGSSVLLGKIYSKLRKIVYFLPIELRV
jgi:hypothetical protein